MLTRKAYPSSRPVPFWNHAIVYAIMQQSAAADGRVFHIHDVYRVVRNLIRRSADGYASYHRCRFTVEYSLS